MPSPSWADILPELTMNGAKALPRSANGVGLSPDGNTVYVAETETSRLRAFDVIGPGSIRKKGFPSPHGARLIHGPRLNYNA